MSSDGNPFKVVGDAIAYPFVSTFTAVTSIGKLFGTEDSTAHFIRIDPAADAEAHPDDRRLRTDSPTPSLLSIATEPEWLREASHTLTETVTHGPAPGSIAAERERLAAARQEAVSCSSPSSSAMNGRQPILPAFDKQRRQEAIGGSNAMSSEQQTLLFDAMQTLLEAQTGELARLRALVESQGKLLNYQGIELSRVSNLVDAVMVAAAASTTAQTSPQRSTRRWPSLTRRDSTPQGATTRQPPITPHRTLHHSPGGIDRL